MIWVSEAPLGDRGRRTLLALEPELVGVLAADVVLLGDALGALELAHELVVLEVRAADRLAVAGLGTGDGVATDRQQAHGLDATASTTSSAPLAMSAIAVFTACWLLPHCASTVVAATSSAPPWLSQAVRVMFIACAPTLLMHPAHDLIDVARRDAGALDHFHHHRAEYVGGMGAGQRSVALADRGTTCFDDDDLGHGTLLGVRCCAERTIPPRGRRCSTAIGDAVESGSC